MSVELNEVSASALDLLKEKLHEWRDSSSPAWHSAWPVFERLIERHDEMTSVYRELAALNITGPRLWVLLEQLVFAGSFGTEEQHTGLRADYQELTVLNEDISVISSQLAAI
ncbi:hypothetical protein [Photorhabdus khanii]|uniref:Uncharacterized protein n=1 Tax=Photorhabdus khanii subsp. guanajuatensis TaxID=2100166 RepID=A0A4R4IPR1_9GAMM|nr:hypothetical protein [Photorhabdus khanii]TDB42620.1 hypothetical protein C5467_23770 [Photorhabdus khanii subsp. guanajuatensis]